MRWTVTAVIAAVFVLGSCSKESDPVLEIPSRIQPFVDDFLQEAALRGEDILIDDLIIRFNNELEVNGKPAAGVCRRQGSKTPVIEFDTTSLNWTISEESREQLVFHELGHCIIKREHDDRRMGSANFRTLMRASGEVLYGDLMTGFKRVYYLDELFDRDTPEPLWATEVPFSNISGDVRSEVFIEDFEDNANNWTQETSSNIIRQVVNGVYDMQSLSSNLTIFSPRTTVYPAGDFEIETTFRFVSSTGYAVLLWGAQSAAIKDFYYIYVTTSGNAVVGTFEDGVESTLEGFFETPASEWKLTIRNLNGQYLIYLNERQIDILNFTGLNGNVGGLGVGPNAHVRFEDFNVYSLD